ncbi:hypothetical protein BGX33_011018 [Mortierella sp. NVP41]|nr:hypothetical protein BGX33_011018 [Mortierella sp. NVP41]
MTIAAAAALVSSSARASFNPVYADESEEQSGFGHDHRSSLYPHLENRSDIHPEQAKTNFRGEAYSRTHSHANSRSVVAPEEELFPGLAYVALAGLTGSLVARKGSVLMKTLSPVAFASAAGYYFLPHTTRNLLGVDQASYDKWSASHASSSTSSHTSTSALPRADLASKAREAWHSADIKANQLDSKIDNKAQEVKSWWNKNSSIAEDNIKSQVNDAKSWVETKAQEADKAFDNAQAKASDAINGAVGWVEDKSRLVERTAENAAPPLPSTSSSVNKSETEKAWLHHKQDQQPESTTKNWFSSRSSTSGAAGVGTAGAASGPESRDRWSNRQERGNSKIHEDGGHWFRRADFNNRGNGTLDNKDVDVWSSTKEEIGTARMDETPYANMHRQPYVNGRLPHETEYWTNGEEISSADVRNSNYYNWPGSHTSPSLGRASWWDRRFRNSTADFDSMSSLKSSTESLAWESKQAAERAALDHASRLAQEQSELERRTAEAKAKAEDADRHVAEQRNLAEQTWRQVQERVMREKVDAEAAAAQVKAKAEAWASEQKEKAEMAAKDIRDRVLRETAAAEKTAQDTKAALELRIREERLKVEHNAREIGESIRIEKAKEEQANAELRAQAEAYAREQRIKIEKVAKEVEAKLAMEREQRAKARAEAEIAQKKLDAEKAAKAARELEIRMVREREEAAALEMKRAAERKEKDDRLAFEKAELSAREAKARAETMLVEKKRHADLTAEEMERVKAVEKAEVAARDSRLKTEAMLLEQKRASEKALKVMEQRLAAETAKADALLSEKKAIAGRAAKEMEQKLSAERAEAEALAAKNRAESNLAEKKRTAEVAARETASLISRESAAKVEREARLRTQMEGLKAEMRESASSASSSSSSWGWPWSSPSSTTTTTATTSTKHTHDHSHEGFDSTGHLMEHIVEDIKQTKDDLADGLHHLKDAVLGAEAKAAEATTKTKETTVEAINAAKPESRSWWSSGSSYSTSSSSTPDIGTNNSDLGTNIEAAASKAERDIKAKSDTFGRNMTETARKAYDNVIDAATTVDGQRDHSHHHHEHTPSGASHDSHNLMDHIRDDLRQTKDSLQSGVESLKETIFGAEQATNKATDDLQKDVEQVKEEGRRWWSAKTHEAEKTAGLNKASDKVHEFDDNMGNIAGREASDDYWFHAEQARQQQQSRGSGRAM